MKDIVLHSFNNSRVSCALKTPVAVEVSGTALRPSLLPRSTDQALPEDGPFGPSDFSLADLAGGWLIEEALRIEFGFRCWLACACGDGCWPRELRQLKQ